MKTIWKFPLAITALQQIRLPYGAEILCVQMQFGEPQLWALVDDASAHVPYNVAMYGTGHTLPDRAGAYLGTLQAEGGKLMLHVFGSLA